MASSLTTLSDDELRTRLLSVYGDHIPPIVDTTRSLLISKLATLKSDLDVSSSQVQIRDDSVFFKTLVFLDIEATGLPCDTLPPRITELHLQALDTSQFIMFKDILELYRDSDEIDLISPSRITHSLNICVNPATLIPDQVSDMTGLTNELLEHQPKFSSKTVQLIAAFLTNLPQPYCLIAHNGFKYDFPLLKAEILKTGYTENIDYYVLDSLQALKTILILREEENTLQKKPRLRDSQVQPRNSELLREQSSKKKFGRPPKSFALSSLHQHMFGVKPKKVHGASHDVHSLIRVCASSANHFVEYSKRHCEKLSSVKQMW